MLRTRSEHACFGGTQGFYELDSAAIGGPMRFAVFLPPPRSERPPVVYYLAGLSSTEETFPMKAGPQRVAASLGLALVSCDTSPRHARYPGDDADWDFGQSAGFYVNATEEPWRAAYQMETHVASELAVLVEANFPVAVDRRGIMGHSMGGHGALVLSLRYPGVYRSVSALAPIVAPSLVPWGQKAFRNYLGEDRSAWAAYDTCELLRAGKRWETPPLVDQGLADKFLDRELRPDLLEAACAETGVTVSVQRHTGYDHSYYFVASMIEEQLRHHAALLVP